jgi:hypothetical protein
MREECVGVAEQGGRRIPYRSVHAEQSYWHRGFSPVIKND